MRTECPTSPVGYDEVRYPDTEPGSSVVECPIEAARLRQLAAQALKPVPLPTRLGDYKNLLSVLGCAS